jgi:prophage regulatory protein
MAIRAVLGRTGLTRSMTYALLKDGLFPRPINLGPRAVGWLESEIDGWIAERVQASRAKSA